MKNSKPGPAYQKHLKTTKNSLYSIIIILNDKETTINNCLFDKNSKMFITSEFIKYHKYEVIDSKLM